MYDGSKGVARYDAKWKAYQAELALEEIVYGRPFSESDYQLNISLGTSTVGQFSLSYKQGFIGLAPHKAASDGEVLLLLRNCIKSGLQMERINRLFPRPPSLVPLWSTSPWETSSRGTLKSPWRF